MMNGLVVVDAGPIISLAQANKLSILDGIFDEIKIPLAVWVEVTSDESKPFISEIKKYFKDKVLPIKGFNDLTFVMDGGESESIILYQEIQADFLLIDDKKARAIAENLNIKCIGTIGLLAVAKDKGIVSELKPIFKSLIANKRFYSLELLNKILELKGEDKI